MPNTSRLDTVVCMSVVGMGVKRGDLLLIRQRPTDCWIGFIAYDVLSGDQIDLRPATRKWRLWGWWQRVNRKFGRDS